ncbi:hypothetical protein C8P68_11247 [Mucilaginibacter yixingensis]|uniref:Endosialidase-like protein n=1 Tax=Mucilaginibacter yixingensis TaxID=1295612 RepID=A0A2T5J4Q4_9SPHI|nr:hypothetical protein [Mucilaginibacter yixingensis]PTQ92447.1 hypothetical protein C8P68_11247 [Mucilaginibacter yixingensis]
MKKLAFSLLAMMFAFNFSHAQWNNGTNITNNNTGYVGVSTSLFVSGGAYQYAIPTGALLVGHYPQQGVYIPPPTLPSYQHSIVIDQPNDRIYITHGNSDQGGGIQRPGENTGETRFFSLPNYNASQPGYLTFYNNTTESMRLVNGYLGIGTVSPSQPLSVNINASGKGISLGNYNTLSAGGFAFVGITGADGTFNGGNLSSGDNGSTGMAIVHTSGGLGNSAELAFVTHNNGSDSRERVRIDRFGNVGIGTTTPQKSLHVVGTGATLDGGDTFPFLGGGAVIQANTGNRSTTNGAQLEFAIPADVNGGNVWGQARIVTIGDNSLDHNATGKMILGTRRSFNKLGTGNQWYYGNDITIDGSGNVGIGTTTPREALSVNGTIRSKQVKVEIANWPDFVFKPAYSLSPLSEVKAYIDQNQHLPEVPAAATVEKEGMDVAEMNKILLKKVEELTLYLIEKDKEIDSQKKKDLDLEARLSQLEKLIKK